MRRRSRRLRPGIEPAVVPCGARADEAPAPAPATVSKLEPILTDWCLPEDGLYFVTLPPRARPAKVSALADCFAAKLTAAAWRLPAA
jgi:hypothetical protein